MPILQMIVSPTDYINLHLVIHQNAIAISIGQLLDVQVADLAAHVNSFIGVGLQES